RHVDLDVLVERVEDRDDAGAGLRQLARPDELRLHDGGDAGRVDRVLRERHLELLQLRDDQLAPLAQHVQLAARDGDLALLGLGAGEDVGRAVEPAGGLVAPGARVVERLRRARAGGGQVLFAAEGPPREVGRRLRLAQLGAVRADVARPGALDQLDLLRLALEVGLDDVELLALGADLRARVVVVEAGEDGVRGGVVALAEGRLEDAGGDLAPPHALLALDESRPVRRRPLATHRPEPEPQDQHDGGHHEQAFLHSVHLWAAISSSSGRPIRRWSSARRPCASYSALARVARCPASSASASSTSSLVARPASNCWRRMRRFSSAWPTATCATAYAESRSSAERCAVRTAVSSSRSSRSVATRFWSAARRAAAICASRRPSEPRSQLKPTKADSTRWGWTISALE